MVGRWLVGLLLLVAAGPARGAPPDVIVEGRVVDDVTGAPIASATVTLQDPRYSEPPATTDEDGRFRLVRETIEAVASSRTNRAQVVVRAAGWAPAAIEPAGDLWPCRHVGLEVRLSRPIPHAGRIVDPAGAPLAGVQVQVMGTLRDEGDDGEQPPDTVEHDWRTTTDRDGRFVIDDLAPDEPGVARVHVVVTSRGLRQLGRRAHDVRPGDAPLEVVLAPEATIDGTVVDPAGAPIPGARISRFQLDATPSTSRRARPAEEDEVERGFRFSLSRSGTDPLRLRDRGPGRFTRVPDDPGYERRIARLRGLVTLSAADGRFALGPLTPGRRLLAVAAPGFGEQLLEVEAPTTGLRVVLHPARRLRGRVVRAGAPVVEAIVWVLEPGRADDVARTFAPDPAAPWAWESRFERGAAITDAAGRFEVDGLGDRSATVAAVAWEGGRLVLLAQRDDVPTDGEPITLQADPKEAR